MAEIKNNFESGPAGTDVTTANSGGSGNTAVTIVSKGGAATVKYDATGKAHGNYGARVVMAGGTDSMRLRWDFTADPNGVASLRVHFTLNSLPSMAQDLGNITSSSGQCVKFGLTVGNNFRVSNRTGANIGSVSPSPLVAGTNYCFQLQVKKGTGTADGQAAYTLSLGDTGTLVYPAQSSTTTDTGTADYVQFHLGEGTAGRVLDITWDDPLLRNTTQAPLGPAVPANVAPTASAGPDQTVDSFATVTLDSSGSSDSDGTITRVWTPPAGVTLSSTTATSPTFTAPADAAGASLTFGLTITDNGGLTASDSVVVTVRPHVEWLKTAGGLVPMRRTL